MKATSLRWYFRSADKFCFNSYSVCSPKLFRFC